MNEEERKAYEEWQKTSEALQRERVKWETASPGKLAPDCTEEGGKIAELEEAEKKALEKYHNIVDN